MNGPVVESYGLVRGRDRTCLASFLERYGVRATGDALVSFPLWRSRSDYDSGRYEEVSSIACTAAIELGLANPDAGFFIGGLPSRSDVDGLRIGFTFDGHLILGLDLCPDLRGCGLERSIELLDSLRELGCREGLVLSESPPPLHRDELLELARQSLFAIVAPV